MVLFLIDLIANFAVIKPKKLWKSRKILYFECLLQIYFYARVIAAIWI